MSKRRDALLLAAKDARRHARILSALIESGPEAGEYTGAMWAVRTHLREVIAQVENVMRPGWQNGRATRLNDR